jgi:putative endonuclease
LIERFIVGLAQLVQSIPTESRESRRFIDRRIYWGFSSAGSEHLPYKQRVGGSNPSTPTNQKSLPMGLFSLMYSVYILYSEKLDKFYIGFSANISDRLLKHNRSNKGFTSLGKPWLLMCSESFLTKREAMAREKQLKNWKNPERLKRLIQTGSEHPD